MWFRLIFNKQAHKFYAFEKLKKEREKKCFASEEKIIIPKSAFIM